MFFRKKKIYKVEYRDRCDDYGSSVVSAKDPADAWKKTLKQFWECSSFKPTVCIAITELTNA